MPSLIDPTDFPDGVPVAKADLRASLTAAKTEMDHAGFYLSGGSGALERDTADRIADQVSVRDFGAIGNNSQTSVGTAWVGVGKRYADLTIARVDTGIADLALTDTVDWAAFQMALNLNVLVLVPPGQYKINRSLYSQHILLQGVKGKGWSGANVCRIDTTESFGQKPLLMTQPRWFDWSYTQQGSGSWVGGSFYLADLSLHHSDPLGCVAQFMSVVGASKIERCWIGTSGRGIAIGGCYETSVENCYFTGFMGYGTRAANWQSSDWANGVGLFAHNHCSVRTSTFHQMGVGIDAQGYAVHVAGCRAEGNVLGYRVGRGTYVNIDAGYPFPTNYGLYRSSIHACSAEANRYGAQVSISRASSLRDFECQGSGGTPGTYNHGGTGIEIVGIGEACVLENISTAGTFEEGGAIVLPTGHGSTYSISNLRTTQGDTTRPSFAKSMHMLTENGNRQRPDYNLNRVPLNPTQQTNSNTGGTTTAFHDLQLRGLKALNAVDPNIQPSNLGKIVAVATGANTHAVTFQARRTRNDATTFTVTTDVGSTLPPGTYYYGATYIAARGETGLDTLDSTPPYKTRVVASGQRVTIVMPRGADWTTRVYRGTAVGDFSGYWQAPYGTGNYTMQDNGAVPFDGVDLPPPNGSWIPAETEPDANYGIIALPSWSTICYVTGKTTAGFTLNFPTQAPASQTVQWLLFRP